MLKFEYTNPLPSDSGPITGFGKVLMAFVYSTPNGLFYFAVPSEVPARDYYGPIPDAMLVRTPYRRIWSDTDPDRWKLLIDGCRTRKGSSRITLGRPSVALSVGDSINFIETTDNGDDVNEVFSEAVVIHKSADNRTITVGANATSDSIGYVTRSTYASDLAGYDDSMITGGNTILRIVSGLKETAVICHDRGFLFMTPTGNSLAPFSTTEAYTGPDGLWLPWCVNVIGSKVVYRAKNRWMEFSILNTTPVENSVMGLVRELFDGLTVEDSDSIFTQYNAVDRQVWTFLPSNKSSQEHGQIVCYDVDTETANTISTSGDVSPILFTGSGSVVRSTIGKTGAEDWWWMLGTPGGRIALMHVMRSGATVCDRFGNPTAGTLQFGDIGTPLYETAILNYYPELRTMDIPGGEVSMSISSYMNRNGYPIKTIESRYPKFQQTNALDTSIVGPWIREKLFMKSSRGASTPALLRRSLTLRIMKSVRSFVPAPVISKVSWSISPRGTGDEGGGDPIETIYPDPREHGGPEGFSKSSTGTVYSYWEDSVTLTASCTGGDLRFEWKYSGDGRTWVDIPGAKSASYVIKSMNPAHKIGGEGFYKCVARNYTGFSEAATRVVLVAHPFSENDGENHNMGIYDRYDQRVDYTCSTSCFYIGYNDYTGAVPYKDNIFAWAKGVTIHGSPGYQGYAYYYVGAYGASNCRLVIENCTIYLGSFYINAFDYNGEVYSNNNTVEIINTEILHGRGQNVLGYSYDSNTVTTASLTLSSGTVWKNGSNSIDLGNGGNIPMDCKFIITGRGTQFLGDYGQIGTPTISVIQIYTNSASTGNSVDLLNSALIRVGYNGTGKQGNHCITTWSIDDPSNSTQFAFRFGGGYLAYYGDCTNELSSGDQMHWSLKDEEDYYQILPTGVVQVRDPDGSWRAGVAADFTVTYCATDADGLAATGGLYSGLAGYTVITAGHSK